MGAAFRYPVCGDLLAQAQKIHPTLHRNLNRFAGHSGTCLSNKRGGKGDEAAGQF